MTIITIFQNISEQKNSSSRLFFFGLIRFSFNVNNKCQLTEDIIDGPFLRLEDRLQVEQLCDNRVHLYSVVTPDAAKASASQSGCITLPSIFSTIIILVNILLVIGESLQAVEQRLGAELEAVRVGEFSLRKEVTHGLAGLRHCILKMYLHIYI